MNTNLNIRRVSVANAPIAERPGVNNRQIHEIATGEPTDHRVDAEIVTWVETVFQGIHVVNFDHKYQIRYLNPRLAGVHSAVTVEPHDAGEPADPYHHAFAVVKTDLQRVYAEAERDSAPSA